MFKQAFLFYAILITIILATGLAIPALAQSSDPPDQDILVLKDEPGEYSLGRYLDILEDTNGELTIDDVTSAEYEARFSRSQVDVPIYGYTHSAYWLRLRLRNESSQINEWLLETAFQNLNFVDIYLPTEGEGYIKKESGILRPFNSRDIPYYLVVFKIPLASQEEQTIYMRVTSGSSMTLAFKLWAPITFALNKLSEMLETGLFYGALLIVLGYHLFIFFSLREASYLYFVLFIASTILFFASYEGIADQFLWPRLSQSKLYFIVIGMTLFFITALKFSGSFLEQKTRAPLFHKIFYIISALWALMIVIIPFSSYLFMNQITTVGRLVTSVIVAVAGLYSWRKGYLPARFFIISWLGFVLGMIVISLVRLGVLPSTDLTEKSYQIGLIWLVSLSSLALADRIKMLKSQTEDTNRLLRNSESRLAQTLEGLPLGVVVYGKDQKPNYSNLRSVKILGNPSQGIEPDASAGRTLAQAIDYFSFRISGTDQPYPLEKLPITRALNGEPASTDDIEADLVDKRVPLEIWANPIKDDLGNVETAVVAFQDITERKKAETELNDYRHHLERLVDQRTVELSLINEQLNQEMADRKLLEEVLRKRIEWLSAANEIHQVISSTADLPHAFGELSTKIIDLLGAKCTFIGLLDAQNDQIKMLCLRQSDGSPQPVIKSPFRIEIDTRLRRDLQRGKIKIFSAGQASALLDLLGECTQQMEGIHSVILAPIRTRQTLVGLLGLGMQLQEGALLPKEADLVERITIDLADLVEVARLFEKSQALAASEERNRLARDLHDSVTQVLFSASLVAEVLPKIWQRNPDMAEQSIDELRRLTRGALAEMRTMLLELRPAGVIKIPLGELLAQLTEAITSRSGLPFQLFIEKIPPLPEEVHTGFYRIAQESLNNVVKHAQASLVTVSLSATTHNSEPRGTRSEEIKMVIKDNGRGFSNQEGYTEHMGMSIIRERAAAINGVVIINSQTGNGTEVILVWHN